MRRLLPLVLLAALVAVAGCGGSSAQDKYAKKQVAACVSVQKTLAAIKKPKPVRRNVRLDRAVQAYAVKVDRALLGGVQTLRAVSAPASLKSLQRQWLVAVEGALQARLELDTVTAKRIQQASRTELKRRRAANDLAGSLGVADGCTLTY